MSPGEVVLIQFPFTDLTSTRVRPGVIVSSPQFNTGEDVIVMMVTSAASRSTADVRIRSSDPEFPATGLKVDSTFRAGKIYTLSKHLIKRRLGVVGPSLRTRLKKAILSVLGI